MQEISHEAKLDAFTTLMEVKKSAQNCTRKNGCNFGYDYCATSKCGPCQVMPQNSYKGGACTPLSVDVDQELDVVNSMNKAELLDIATKVMDNTVAAGPTHSYAKQGSFAAASWVDPNAPKKIDDDTYDDDQPTLLSASVTDVDFEKKLLPSLVPSSALMLTLRMLPIIHIVRMIQRTPSCAQTKVQDYKRLGDTLISAQCIPTLELVP